MLMELDITKAPTLKYHLYHFYLIHEQMKDIIQVIYEIEQSNVPDIWQVKAWVTNSQMLILKYHNYYKDWKQAKALVDPKIAEVVNDWFKRVDDTWSDLEKYRNET